MTHDTLVSVDTLAAALEDPGAAGWLVLDCRFDLANPLAGRRSFDASHIPGAFHVDLEQALSGPKGALGGRHPLPDRATFARCIAALGADDDTQIVACDNAGGMYAARLWWMLRWAGHRAAAVLDGGVSAWTAAGRTLSADPSAPRPAGSFSERAPLVAAVSHAELRTLLKGHERLVIDARAPDRFRGENETLDPVGGHIPGARNRLFRDNLAADGRFKTAAQLREEFEAITGGRPPAELVHQCGSGVTACHNLLALEVAGLPGGALYPGSWSEWCAQPGAPMATGPTG
jgi:thiosulfate/3-mercaptopyruvate sulfurtransferase